MRLVLVILLVALVAAENDANPIGRLKTTQPAGSESNLRLARPGVRWVIKFGKSSFDVYGVRGGMKSGGRGDVVLRTYSLAGAFGDFVQNSINGKKPRITLELLFLDENNVATEIRTFRSAQLKSLDLPRLGFEKHKPISLTISYSKVDVSRDPKTITCADVERTGVINTGFFHFKANNRELDLASFAAFTLHGGDKNLKLKIRFDVSNPKTHNFVQTWADKRKSFPVTLAYIQNSVRGTLQPLVVLEFSGAKVYRCNKNKSECDFLASSVSIKKISRD